MAFSFSAFMSMFPYFLISGILSLLFFLEVRNLSVKRKEIPLFILVSEETAQTSVKGSSRNYTELRGGSQGYFWGMIQNIQLAMLAVNIWILLTILLLPSSGMEKLLPAFSLDEQYLVYSAMGVIFVISFLSTVVLRISSTKPKIIATLGIVATGIFLVFLIPSMQWISSYSSFMRGIILYAVIASSLFLTYGFFTLPSKKVEKVSIAGTLASYLFTSALLFANLVQVL